MIHTIDLGFLDTPQTIAAYVLEHPDGPVLIETGPYSTYPALEQGLQKIGIAPESLQAVLLTHIHLDHAGSAWAFAQKGVPIFVHPLGERHLAQPEKLLASAKRIYQDMMDQLWGTMEPIATEQLRTVKDGTEVLPGIRALHSPGHAVHHIAWQWEDVIFTGDVAGVRIGNGIVVPPCPPPDIQVEDWQRSIQVLREASPTSLYLTHYGEITDVETHLDALEKRLLDWANWMKPRFEAGDSVTEIAPDFEQYVRKELVDHGLDQEGLRQYDAANPPWMSVAGLLRYWKKKSERS